SAHPPVRTIRQQDRASWCAQVEDIRRGIGSGDYEKVVPARRTDLTFDGPVDSAAVLAELAGRHANCFRFAFRPRQAMFVGASPERLLALHDGVVETDAMAGSIAGDASVRESRDAAARALLESRKDRSEQAVVTSSIER